MVTKSKVAPPTGKVAERRTASHQRATEKDSGAARTRSKKVANEIAMGKRNMPEEEHKELPLNATPLDVLIMAMRRAYLLGGSIAAAPYAEKAAPFLHAKISSIELKNPATGGSGSGGPVPFRVVFTKAKERNGEDNQA